MSWITKEKIEEYFGSLEKLKEFYQFDIDNAVKEIEEIKSYKRYDWFTTRVCNISTNNAPAHELMDKFVMDYILLREKQTQVKREIIKEAEALYENYKSS